MIIDARYIRRYWVFVMEKKVQNKNQTVKRFNSFFFRFILKGWFEIFCPGSIACIDDGELFTLMVKKKKKKKKKKK
jgi:hypothetical protein